VGKQDKPTLLQNSHVQSRSDGEQLRIGSGGAQTPKSQANPAAQSATPSQGAKIPSSAQTAEAPASRQMTPPASVGSSAPQQSEVDWQLDPCEAQGGGTAS
jgi:hypothetical protein